MVARLTYEEFPPEKPEWTVTPHEARVLRSALREVSPLAEWTEEAWIPTPEEARNARRSWRRAPGNSESVRQRQILVGSTLFAAIFHFIVGPLVLPGLYSEGDVLKRMATHVEPLEVQVVMWAPAQEPEPPPVEVVKMDVVAPTPAVVEPPRRVARTLRKAPRKASIAPPERKTVVAGNAVVTPIVSQTEGEIEVAGSGEAVGAPDDTGIAVDSLRGIAPVPGIDMDALFASYVSRVGRDVKRDFRYPRSLVRSRVEGTVVIEIIVDRIGRIQGYKVAQSSGSRQLDRAALKAMKTIQSVSVPPDGLEWTERAIRVPFVYRLKRSA